MCFQRGGFFSPNLYHVGAGETSQTGWVLGEEELLWPVPSQGRDRTERPYYRLEKADKNCSPTSATYHSPCLQHPGRLLVRPVCVGTCGCSSKGTTCMWVCSFWGACRETVFSLGLSHSAQPHGPVDQSPPSS